MAGSSLRSAAPWVAATLALVLGFAVGSGLRGPLLEARMAPDVVAVRAREILAGKHSSTRTRELAELFRNAGPESVDVVVAAFEQFPPSSHGSELVLLAEWWGEFDPETALGFIQQRGLRESAHASAALLRVWARDDPSQALERALAPRDADYRKVAVASVFIGWDESLQPGMMETLQQLPAEIDAGVVAGLVARRQVFERGPREALDWAHSPLDLDPELLTQIRNATISAAAWRDPKATAAWADPHIESERRTGLPMRIATRWVKQDPPAAMDWLRGLADSRDRAEAVEESYRDWLRADRPAAASWLEEQEPAAWLDGAYSIRARAAAGSNPEKAVSVARKISNPKVRETTLVIVARVWRVSNPEAAEAWLADSELSPQARQRARALPGGRRAYRRYDEGTAAGRN